MVGDECFEAAETVLDGSHYWRCEEGSAFLGEDVAVQRLDGVGDADAVIVGTMTVLTVEQAAAAD